MSDKTMSHVFKEMFQNPDILGLNTPLFLNRQFRLDRFPARQILIVVSEQRMRHYQVRNKRW
jgi:hypothetical protein